MTEKDEAVGILRKKGFTDVVAQMEGTKLSFIETSFSRSETYQKARLFLKENQATYLACATDNIAVALAASVDMIRRIMSFRRSRPLTILTTS